MSEINKRLTYGFYVLLVLTGIYDFTVNGGEKFLRIILIFVTLIGLQIVYKRSLLKKSSVIYKVILGFIFISMYLANVWNFYGIEHYDKFLHLLSGGILGFIGLAFYMYMFNIKEKKEIDIKKLIIFILMFLVSIAGLWEIWEFTTDSLFGLMAQNGLEDTMWDIILGTVGGIIVLIPIINYSKGKRVPLIEEFLKDVNE
ncbi:hypothetical protein [uncultured Clostridium sp.]|uniref:hypothetical protein n=1 Tax=uncultured Clostridium sp. TaxID=59620 RepID=UPI00262EDA4F|nr:hypothetical protein [uncultured Clostridium sp.]